MVQSPALRSAAAVPHRWLVEGSLMVAGGLVSHAATWLLVTVLAGDPGAGVHGFHPAIAGTAVIVALVLLVQHHLGATLPASRVVGPRVLVGQTAVLAAILTVEWATAGGPVLHDPWLWVAGLVLFALMGGWELLERATMCLADVLRGPAFMADPAMADSPSWSVPGGPAVSVARVSWLARGPPFRASMLPAPAAR